MPPEKPHWVNLLGEVVRSGLCTGCAACVIACPHDVLRYDDREGPYRPWKVDEDGGAEDCTHGQRGCTLCTRACPRFRSWEVEADTFMYGRPRNVDEVYGVSQEIVLARATDDKVRSLGQDGGAVSAMLIWALDHSMIDCALVSSTRGDKSSFDGMSDGARQSTNEDLQGDNSGMVGETSASDMSGEQNSGLGAVRPVPAFVTDRQGVLNASGSRYTYSTNTLAYFDAVGAGFEKIAIVGTGCQASIPAVMNARKAGKVGRRLVLSIGLLCSKTFDETMYEELFEAGYGIGRDSIAKVNIKGRFQVWMQDGSYAEVPLKEGRKWTREGCKLCPDFAAEHADVSAGGIGELAGWTILIIRTEAGKQLVDGAHGDGAIEIRPVTEDPSVIDLLVKLSRASRKRWPQDGSTYHEPGILPEPVVS